MNKIKRIGASILVIVVIGMMIIGSSMFTFKPKQIILPDSLKIAKKSESINYSSRVHVEDMGVLSSVELSVYHQIVDFAGKVARGEMDQTVLNLDVSEMLGQTTFTAEELGVKKIKESNKYEYAGQLLRYNISDFLDVMLFEYPYEFFWFDKCVGIHTDEIKVSCDDNILYLPETITIHMAVSDDYVGAEQYTVNSERIAVANKAMNYAQTIINQAKTMSDYDKLAFYRDQICSLTDYCRDLGDRDTSAGGYGDPWQLIYVFDQDPDTKVKCEGYTKAFQYLCDHTEFDDNVWVYTVRGKKNQGKHCWNIVHMEDDQFYLADITTSDNQSKNNRRRFFLEGADSGNVEKGFRYDEKVLSLEEETYTVPAFTYTYHESALRMWSEDMLNISNMNYSLERKGNSTNGRE